MSDGSSSANEMLDVLHELGLRLQDSPQSVGLAQEALEVLEEGMGYELLAVLVPRRDGAALQPLALSRQGRDAAFLEADRAYVASSCAGPVEGLTGWVARTGRSALVGDVTADERYHGIREGIRSELCVPLRVGGDVVGVLNTETARPEAYTRADRRFLETVAGHLALAIERAGERRLASDARSERSALTTICCYCKCVQAEGAWISPEGYLDRRGVRLTHGICPTCYERVAETQLGE